MNKIFLAEGIGTGVLALAVLLSSATPSFLPTPILASLIVMLFVYTIGGISGCHINPAVTLGLWSIKKIPTSDAMLYILSQILGALSAFIIIQVMGVQLSSPLLDVPLQAYVFEMLGVAVLTFGIASVVFDPQKLLISGVIIGGSLLLGIALSSLGGGAGILNPAVALSLKTMHVGYYIAEIIGGVIGFQLYAFLIPLGKKR